MTARLFRGDRLQQERERRGWTKQALMRKAQIGPNQIGRYENGEQEPTASVIARLAEQLEVTTDYLLGLTDKPDQALTEADLSPDEMEFILALRAGKLRTLLHLIDQTFTDEETVPDLEEQSPITGQNHAFHR